jgi:hypothetical protein
MVAAVQPQLALQRGGGGRGGGGGGGSGAAAGGGESSPVPEAEVAAQAALAVLQQVPLELTIAATATDIVFRDPRGEWPFKLDDKTSEIEVPGGRIKVRSRWDRLTIRQDFSSTQRKVVKIWSLDGNDHLVLAVRVESLTFNSTESRAVFDRQ